MIVVTPERTLIDVGAVENHWHVVCQSIVSFVPGDDQERVVVFGPSRVTIEMGAQPLISLGDRPVVHVIEEIRDDKGNSRKICKVFGKIVDIALNGNALRKGLPWIVPLGASALNEPDESIARPLQNCCDSRAGLLIDVVIDPEGTSRIKRKIIWLAWVRNGVVVCEKRAECRQRIDIAGFRISDNFFVGVILLD